MEDGSICGKTDPEHFPTREDTHIYRSRCLFHRELAAEIAKVVAKTRAKTREDYQDTFVTEEHVRLMRSKWVNPVEGAISYSTLWRIEDGEEG